MDYDTQKQCGAFGTCLDGTRYACANVCDGGSPASMGCYTGNNCDQTTCGGYWWGDPGATCGVDPNNAWAWESMEYFHYDALGSVRLVVDFPVNSSNYTITRHDYLPFGEEIQAGTFGRTADLGYGVDPTPRRFTGKERDPESGLDYFGARYYSAAQGRFTSADWSAQPVPVAYADFLNPQTLNLYAYVDNNPCSRFDSDGHCCEENWDFFKLELKGMWQTTGGAVVGLGGMFVSGEAFRNMATTGKMLVNDPASILEAGNEFGVQVGHTVSEATHGNPEAIGEIAGMVIGPKATRAVAQGAMKGLNVAAFGSRAGRAFWSGTGAEEMAAQSGRVLSQTRAGRVAVALDKAGLQGTRTSRFMWNQLSKGYAWGATGDVYSFNFNPLNKTYATVEMPILLANPSVNLYSLGW